MPRVWNKRDPNCPKDAIYCGRPGPYGNPHVVGRYNTRVQAIAKFRVDMVLLKRNAPRLYEQMCSQLRGHDLSCWCHPLPCHCDVLLELANAGT